MQLPTELIKNFKTAGAVTHSSSRLVKRIIDNIDFENTKYLIELGPGNGSITVELLNHMKNDANLWAFEINKAFCELLESIGDRRMKVINESAEYLTKFINPQMVPGKKYIVSSIPFGILPEAQCDRIMEEIDSISDKDTVFIQYSYSFTQYRRFRKYFPKLKTQFELINIPPAFVFVGRK